MTPVIYVTLHYPFQDNFLKFLDNQNQGQFYLTGGTALSRFYYQHRYSEDLDFFSGAELNNFREVLIKILDAARQKKFSIGTIGNVDKTGENCMFESLRVETFRWNVSVGSVKNLRPPIRPKRRPTGTSLQRLLEFARLSQLR